MRQTRTLLRAPVSVLLSLCICLQFAGCGARPGRGERKPNILILLADHIGSGDLGCEGNTEIPTPNIDSIAAGGIRFTDGYAPGAQPGPSRAGLMTGRYPTRFGYEFNSAARPGLPMTERTFADRLKALGYATCAVGKWHLGDDPGWYPMKRGFDTFYGTVGVSPYSRPTLFIDSTKSPAPTTVEDPAFYTTAAYGAFAADWIRRQDAPWFLYVPFNAAHTPRQATDDLFARVPDTVVGERRRFGATLIGLDDAVGKILGALRETGRDRDTLVVFLSTGGGPDQEAASPGVREGVIRAPFLLRWQGAIPGGTTYNQPVIHLDLLPTALAAAGATPDPAWGLDGVNLLPFLTGENRGAPHPTLCWRFGEEGAIRRGKEKLVLRGLPAGGATLFDLAADPGERSDLAARQPETVTELRALWDAWNAGQVPPISQKESGKKKPAAKGEPRGRGERGPEKAGPDGKRRPPKAKMPRGGAGGVAPDDSGS